MPNSGRISKSTSVKVSARSGGKGNTTSRVLGGLMGFGKGDDRRYEEKPRDNIVEQEYRQALGNFERVVQL